MLDCYPASSGNFLTALRDKPVGTICRWSGILTPKMGPTVCTETSAINYQYLLRNNSEERSSYLLRGVSLKLRIKPSVFASSLVQVSGDGQYGSGLDIFLAKARYSDTSANEDNSFRNHIR